MDVKVPQVLCLRQFLHAMIVTLVNNTELLNSWTLQYMLEM